MNKTKIEWATHTTNPVKGLCPMACTYCYARRMYKRYHWDETIRVDEDGYHRDDWGIAKLKTPSRIFVGSTMELFGQWVPEVFLQTLFQVTRRYPQHTFIFLTKRPENLAKWSPFPKNCHVGVSITGGGSKIADLPLYDVQASVRFISFEPLLSPMPKNWRVPAYVDWLILGQQTPVSAKTSPKIEWIREIVGAADKAKIPVFLKDNLNDLLENSRNGLTDCFPGFWMGAMDNLRQELPRVAVEARP